LTLTSAKSHHRFWAKAQQRSPKAAFGVDCDRLVYSSAFRRLNGVTQVVSADETALFHNRLTHSLKVAQVGIRLAHRVRALLGERKAIRDRYSDGVDARVVRAAALAHDLGHPPFGHIAERELQRLLDPDPDSAEEQTRAAGSAFRLPDSFEGNAQSFRIVTKLAFREVAIDETSDGLNRRQPAALDLTRATLRALLKYPWLSDERLPSTNDTLKKKRKHKWGAYASEFDIFTWARGQADGRAVDFLDEERIEYRNIEAQAMDWADDITYAVHDVEDFFRAGIIPLHMLRHSRVEFDSFFNHAWPRLEPAIGHALGEEDAKRLLHRVRTTLFPESAYTGSRRDREQMHAFASQLIDLSTSRISIADQGVIIPEREQLVLVELLKEMTWYYVIKRPALSSAQAGQVKLIRDLYFGLTRWVVDEGGDLAEIAAGRQDFEQWLFPARLLEYLRLALSSDEKIGCTSYKSPKQMASRAVVDYIASLTESQAIALRARLRGIGGSSMLEQWLQT
jgi:dGTPase